MSPLFPEPDIDLPPGTRLFRRQLSHDAQRDILDEVSRILEEAPPIRLQMPTGPFMINRLTNCGELGWMSDRKGYRYEPLHPVTGRPWPPIPAAVRSLAIELAHESGFAFAPDAWQPDLLIRLARARKLQGNTAAARSAAERAIVTDKADEARQILADLD